MEISISGAGVSSSLIGSYSDGSVYFGSGRSRWLIGSYENGNVDSGSGWSKSLVERYSDGSIYSGSGRLIKLLCGSYDVINDGAASAALLLLFYR